MTTLDDADPRYWGDERFRSPLVCQAQVFAALCAVTARWAAEVSRVDGDVGYAVWCQQRAHRAAENARMMLELAR